MNNNKKRSLGFIIYSDGEIEEFGSRDDNEDIKNPSCFHDQCLQEIIKRRHPEELGRFCRYNNREKLCEVFALIANDIVFIDISTKWGKFGNLYLPKVCSDEQMERLIELRDRFEQYDRYFGVGVPYVIPEPDSITGKHDTNTKIITEDINEFYEMLKVKKK